MSIVSALNRIDYTSDGATLGPYAYSFAVYTTSDLGVYITNPGGSPTLKTILTHYTQSASNIPGGTVGGSINLLATATASAVITIIRNVPDTQPTVFNNLDRADAKTAIEESFDAAVMRNQQNTEAISRAVSWPLNVITASNTLPDPTLSANQGLTLIIRSDGGGIGTGATLAGTITDPVTVPHGGTGQTSLTQNGVVYGNAGAAAGITIAATTGMVLQGAAGIAPVFTKTPTIAQSLTVGSTANNGVVTIMGTAGFSTAFQVSPTLATSATYIWPATNPTATNQALVAASGSSGVLSWTNTPKGSVINGSQVTGNPYAISTVFAAGHGLGIVPTFVTAFLQCINPEGGYAAGDIIYLQSMASTGLITVLADTATLTIATNGTLPVFVSKQATSAFTITAGNWLISAIPYKVNL